MAIASEIRYFRLEGRGEVSMGGWKEPLFSLSYT